MRTLTEHHLSLVEGKEVRLLVSVVVLFARMLRLAVVLLLLLARLGAP